MPAFMENPEKLEIKTDKAEKEPHYNFPEIAEMEPAMISLVEKLKDKIEKGEYDTLISDDIGGRIPTRVLERIIKSRRPKERLNTFLYPGGYSQDFETLKKFIKKNILPHTKNKALVVTEYVSSGQSIYDMSAALETSGLHDFDIAAVVACNAEQWYLQSGKVSLNHTFFCGQSLGLIPRLSNKSSDLGGVEKTYADPDRNRSAYIYSLKKQAHSKQKKQEIQINANNAREDARTMARRVLEKVW